MLYKLAEAPITETRGIYRLLLVSNAYSELSLTNIALSLPAGNFLSASATNRWPGVGGVGANGGSVTVYCVDQIVAGSIVVDSISNVTLWLNGTSAYSGTVNGAQTTGFADLNLDQTSTCNVSGENFVRVLKDAKKDLSNIESNDYTVYHTAAQAGNGYLDNKVHGLNGGGYLKPVRCLGAQDSSCST